MDCSLPGFFVHRVFQARVQEWGAIAFCSLYLLEYEFQEDRAFVLEQLLALTQYLLNESKDPFMVFHLEGEKITFLVYTGLTWSSVWQMRILCLRRTLYRHLLRCGLFV